MKTLYWNYWGLGNPNTVQALLRYVTLNDPDLVFISETRIFKNKVESIHRRLNMEGCFDVEKGENCVGLLFLWKDSLQVDLLFFSKSQIDVEISQGTTRFWFTGMYRTHDRPRKHKDWELLDRLKGKSHLPWLLGGP
ncbi:hypothetical protein HRI_003613700 [Hibiscus trionum]|uniref:Endonuclease/exonuclease/phosphatase domain-containing protein n=1 Tax=Hibiscus trionum TaxID=183268 RepID=A0A9W7INR7_HIBTR|nr:hypothetical protein HRI_003613700 [Hibiscus trionum]